ncbi:hypothetical protein PROFUN_11139 [Planoprotostelium fungivorum]|uniref:Uncharacterized protein n=1 Tax=Planoprotostelium fungivorum TaxID=1890364 RepID=A0A2P6NAT5_9EUKA|nr:hypothetical protein PROFUN_11139 [Planoprotostelium fungivorum]
MKYGSTVYARHTATYVLCLSGLSRRGVNVGWTLKGVGQFFRAQGGLLLCLSHRGIYIIVPQISKLSHAHFHRHSKLAFLSLGLLQLLTARRGVLHRELLEGGDSSILRHSQPGRFRSEHAQQVVIPRCQMSDGSTNTRKKQNPGPNTERSSMSARPQPASWRKDRETHLKMMLKNVEPSISGGVQTKRKSWRSYGLKEQEHVDAAISLLHFIQQLQTQEQQLTMHRPQPYYYPHVYPSWIHRFPTESYHIQHTQPSRMTVSNLLS